MLIDILDALDARDSFCNAHRESDGFVVAVFGHDLFVSSDISGGERSRAFSRIGVFDVFDLLRRERIAFAILALDLIDRLFAKREGIAYRERVLVSAGIDESRRSFVVIRVFCCYRDFGDRVLARVEKRIAEGAAIVGLIPF